jgi:hypothetical protein
MVLRRQLDPGVAPVPVVIVIPAAGVPPVRFAVLLDVGGGGGFLDVGGGAASAAVSGVVMSDLLLWWLDQPLNWLALMLRPDTQALLQLALNKQ